MDKQFATSIVGLVSPDSSGLSRRIMNGLLEDMVAKIVAATAQGALVKVKSLVRLLQLGAVAICPDVDHHPAVRARCLAPLAGEGIKEITLARLGEMRSAPTPTDGQLT